MLPKLRPFKHQEAGIGELFQLPKVLVNLEIVYQQADDRGVENSAVYMS